MEKGISPNREEEKRVRTDFDFELICGTPIKLDGVGNVHPLTLREIGQMSLKKYHEYLGLITIDKNNIKFNENVDIDKIEAFDIIAQNSMYEDEFKTDMEQAFTTFLKERVIFIPKYSVFMVGEVVSTPSAEEGEEDEVVANMIHKGNFDDFSYIIRLQNKLKVKNKNKPKQVLSEKAQRLADRRAKGRAMMAKASGGGQEMRLDDLVSVAGVYTQDIEKALDWTVYQLHDQCDAFMRQEAYKNKYEKYLVGEDPKTLNLENHWTQK